MPPGTYKVTIEWNGLVRCSWRDGTTNWNVGTMYFGTAGAAHEWARGRGLVKAN